MDADMSADVEIAVLKTNYDHLSTKVDEVRTEMRTGIATMTTKLDAIATQLTVQKATNTMRARAMAFLSHGATGVITLAAAKFLHVPLNLG